MSWVCYCFYIIALSFCDKQTILVYTLLCFVVLVSKWLKVDYVVTIGDLSCAWFPLPRQVTSRPMHWLVLFFILRLTFFIRILINLSDLSWVPNILLPSKLVIFLLACRFYSVDIFISFYPFFLYPFPIILSFVGLSNNLIPLSFSSSFM